MTVRPSEISSLHVCPSSTKNPTTPSSSSIDMERFDSVARTLPTLRAPMDNPTTKKAPTFFLVTFNFEKRLIFIFFTSPNILIKQMPYIDYYRRATFSEPLINLKNQN